MTTHANSLWQGWMKTVVVSLGVVIWAGTLPGFVVEPGQDAPNHGAPPTHANATKTNQHAAGPALARAAANSHPLPEMLGGQVSVPRGGRDHQPGEILVKLRKDSPTERTLKATRSSKAIAPASLAIESSLGQLLSKHAVSEMKPAFRVAHVAGAAPAQLKTMKNGAPRVGKTREDLFRWYRLSISTNSDLAHTVEALRIHAEVEAVEPNALRRLGDVIPQPITDLPDGTTDPDFDLQWHHEAAKIPNAWNHLKQNGQYPGGSRDVIVAVIDTGVDYNHEELVGAVWTNSGEIPANGIDDDGNGFVDDIHGCSTVSDSRSHSGECTDYYGHGTHVAGIIAATAFNHKGGVGGAFNVQIMSIRAAQYSGNLTAVDIAEAVLYALDNGAEVINMSFGGYMRSQVEEDALEVALSQAVLVAAAGNDGLNGFVSPCYPAALPFVHGVMASTPTGTRAWFSNYGYDLAAPGVSIWSTLPGNQYAAWSGTSMAAPVVSGIAALMRSFFWQRDIYSVRFLMGGLWASGQGSPVVDAYRALTELPQPGVSMMENWLFDEKSINQRNDDDGRVDSGETLHLGIEVINRAGLAKNVRATLRARSSGSVMDDPYVTILNGVAEFGDIGPWNTADNGFIYNSDGVITGATSPLVFRVDPNCPNEHIARFQVEFTFQDGWDPAGRTYTRYSDFEYIVQRGKNLPSVISSNLTLTADEYWMVGGPVLVESGALLTIEPGTQVQWGSISDDPYTPGPQSGYLIVRGALRVNGTADRPVSLFPSYFVAGQTTTITVDSGGTADVSYAIVRNPNLNGFHTIDHAYMQWDAFGSSIQAQRISKTIFHKLRGGGTISAPDGFDTCLFDAGWIGPTPSEAIVNCVFLQDNENNRPLGFAVPFGFSQSLSTENPALPPDLFYLPRFVNGETWVVLPVERGPIQLAETMAQYYGGHVASIRNQAEQDFLENWLAQSPPIGMTDTAYYLGLTDDGHPGQYEWLDGQPVSFWRDQPPQFMPWNHILRVYWDDRSQGTRRTDWAFTLKYGSARYGNGTDHWMAYILRLPGAWSMEELARPVTNGTMLSFVLDHFPGSMRFNAFLNKYWDPNVGTWMRFYATGSPRDYCQFKDNFWGTDSVSLLNHAIVDFYDNFQSGRVNYGTPPVHGFETTYPFVESVTINGLPLVSVPQIEGGPATFTVTFNRDMNTNIQPFVSFGPIPPHTDFQVKPRDTNFFELTNGWLNARTWEGQVWITPVTGDGYHLMRISGAVAADDPWLVSGYDVGRFRFKVQTVGVAAMTLQANGGEGQVELLWQQNDYELLAGYNLYRADNIDGPYTRLNATVIPPRQERYHDTNVLPAVPMFYKFTVVTTDFQESKPSNIASAAPFDTISPVLTHAPINSATPGRQLRLTAEATDNVRVTSVTLHHRLTGVATNYSMLPMINVSSNDWSATILASAVQPPGLEYYLVASDGISQVYSGTALTPHSIVVNDQPTLASVTPNSGPAGGGTPATLSGLQFQAGANVFFGGVLASNIVVLNANQITCVTAPHFPATVEVKVINTNGTQSTLLNGFVYESTGTVVSLPNTAGDFGATVEIALSAANVTSLRAADVTLLFDPSVLSAQSAHAGTLTVGWNVTANTLTPGRVVVSMANSTAASGSGVLAFLSFNVVGRPPAFTPITITNASLNDGAMVTETSSGQFTVNGFWTLSGGMHYFNGGGAVRNAQLLLVGVGSYAAGTDTNGVFTFTNVLTGSYTLTPAKSDDFAGITAYDASLVLQSAAGLLGLSANQVLAADVNRNGLVSSMDAAYILENAVGLLDVPFPNAGKVWDFVPASRSYNLLNGDLTGQDFTAVLIGDVSGNWSPEQVQPPGQPGLASMPGQAVVLALDNSVVRSNRNVARVLFRAAAPGIYSVDLVLSFNSPGSFVRTVDKGAAAESLLLASNTNRPGVVRMALAGATPLIGDGVLLALNLENNTVSDLRILHASVNEGDVPVQTATTASSFDGDGDGLLDLDESSTYSTNPQRADSDGDGLPDGQEVLAGTDPNDPGSLLKMTSISLDPGDGVTLIWASVPGRRYQVEYCPALLGDRPWESLAPPMEAYGETTSLIDPTAATVSMRFYRVRLVDQ